jgi:hypothetical protein
VEFMFPLDPTMVIHAMRSSLPPPRMDPMSAASAPTVLRDP